MKRLIPAIFAGATIASLLILVMIELVSLDKAESGSAVELLPVESIDSVNVRNVFESPPDPDCERAESEFSANLSQSRSCEVDSDCALAHFGCPFGCITAVNRTTLAVLQDEENAFQRACHRCVYNCADPLFEWRAACVRQRCVVRDGSALELEKKTLEHINRTVP